MAGSILFLLSAVLSLVCLVASKGLLTILHTPDEIFVMSRSYFDVLAYGIPFLALYNLTSAVARGLGDSKGPFYVLMATSLFNILGDLVFIGFFSMGIAGAALATVLAQLLSALLMTGRLVQLFRLPDFSPASKGTETRSISPQANGRLPLITRDSLPLFLESLRLALPNILRSAITSFGYLAITNVRNMLGPAVVEGISGAYNIDSFLMLPFVYMGNASSVFSGTNLAAGKPDRVRQGLISMLLCLTAYQLPMLLLIILGARSLLKGFGLNEECVAIGYRFLCTAALFYPLHGLQQILMGYFEGRKRVITSSVVNVSILGVRIAASYLLLDILLADIIAWAEIFSWIYGVVLLVILYRKDWKQVVNPAPGAEPPAPPDSPETSR